MRNLRSILLLLAFPFTVLAQSPYSLSWKVDGPMLGVTGALTATMFAVDKDLPGLTDTEIASLSRNDINSFDRGATRYFSPTASDASTVLEFSLILSPLALLADARIRDNSATVGGMYLETLALAAVLPQITKGSVDRPRPFVYNASVDQAEKTAPDARRSFFSQHTMFAFSSAVFISTVYGDFFPTSPWRPYLWAGSLALATTVGILRVTSGKHFPTDVLVGALLGSAIGYTIPLLHRTEGSAIQTSPSLGPGGLGVSVVFAF